MVNLDGCDEDKYAEYLVELRIEPRRHLPIISILVPSDFGDVQDYESIFVIGLGGFVVIIDKCHLNHNLRYTRKLIVI